jgi:predicted RNA binding protein YcfA (HicA-like mRNA interferase family)
MRLPRDLSGADLARSLAKLGYGLTRQTGSHMRLTRVASHEFNEHHVSIPAHKALPLGTLRSVLIDVAKHSGYTLDEMTTHLFG